jgi:hypothetical protein
MLPIRLVPRCSDVAAPCLDQSAAEDCFHHFHTNQVASTQWGAEDEVVGPAILSRLGQLAEVRGDAQEARSYMC